MYNIYTHITATYWIAFQANRIAGAVYLYLYFTKTVNNYVALQVGIFDMNIALTAFFLAMYVQAVGLKRAKAWVIVWNIFGLLDLAIPFAIFPFNLFDMVYRPEQSLSFFFLHPIPFIFLINVPVAAITHVMLLTNIDLMTTSTTGSSIDKDLKKK